MDRQLREFSRSCVYEKRQRTIQADRLHCQFDDAIFRGSAQPATDDPGVPEFGKNL